MLSDRYQEAVVYAMGLHKDQVRKGSGVPYITHLFAVSVLVMENGGNEDECIAALLHDAAEDQGGFPTLKEIEVRFGSAVAEIVKECSDSLEEDATHKKEWKQRKQDYLSQFLKKSKSAILVSLADKLHNSGSIVRDRERIGEGVFDRFEGKKEGTIWYYQELIKNYKKLEHCNRYLLQELEKTVERLISGT
jgi:(p)ppGpp synthase/HD superfamily hydrolase